MGPSDTSRVPSGVAALRSALERWLARAVLCVWYGAALGVCRLRGSAPPRRTCASGRLVVIGAFHNPGWFVSHATPLGRCGFREVIVITHGTLPVVPGVRPESPPAWLTRIAGRAIAKLVWTFRVARRVDADVIMGFHVVPNSTTALIVGRLLRRPTCYQMTSGPVELIGGGYLSWENPILRRLGRPSPFLERLALGVASRFDLVVVRGRDAKRFVEERVRPRFVEIVPGSVDLGQFPAAGVERVYDAVFVGQLVPRKQPLLFVDMVREVLRRRPIKAAILGDGPLMGEVRRRVAADGLEETIELCGRTAAVGSYLSRARVFVLPSRSEGLSIAMAEAMICGAVPVVANVGDLKDLVRDGETGFLVAGNELDVYVDRILALLEDRELWERLSRNASEAARANNGIDEVTARWRSYLSRLAPAPLPAETRL